MSQTDDRRKLYAATGQGRVTACRGKVRFSAWGDAKRIATRNADAEPKIAYRCAFCHGIHLGHPDRLATLSARAQRKRMRGTDE